MTSGANIQIYLSVACLVNPGDEVIIPDPCFVSYESIIKACRGVPIKVPCYEKDQFRLEPSRIESAISSKTKLIIINSPNNPTGSVLPNKSIKAIFDIAKSNNLYLLSDEVYGRMIYDDCSVDFCSPSFFDHCLERTILVHSLSKTYSMTGLRIGAVTGPLMLIEKMALLYETITSCTPAFIQRAAVAAINSSNDYTYGMLAEYQKRRNLILDKISAIEGLSCIRPEGTFYAFVNIKSFSNDSASFSLRLLEEQGVATCPGIYFGNCGEGYVRLCFANSLDKISIAMGRIADFCRHPSLKQQPSTKV